MKYPPPSPAPAAHRQPIALDPVAWRRLWRVVGGAGLGAALGLIAAALVTSIAALTPGWWATVVALLGGGALGVFLAKPEVPHVRRLALAAALVLIGGAFGWEMERVPGALTGAAAGAPTGWLLAWGLEWILGRIAPRWLCVGFWALLAALMTSVGLAAVIKLVLGRLDDDDLAFHFTAIVAVIYLAGRGGWLAEPRADLAAVRDQLRRVWTRLARSPLLPFFAAVLVAGLIAGPAHARYLIDETATTLAIRRETIFVVWPAALAAAAMWIAWRNRRTPARTGFIVLAALIGAGCAYGAHTVLTYRISADVEQVRVHGWTISRTDLVRIEYERKTGRRFVGYQPVFVLTHDRRVALDIDTGSNATAEFLQRAWGVPVTKPK